MSLAIIGLDKIGGLFDTYIYPTMKSLDDLVSSFDCYIQLSKHSRNCDLT